MSPSAGVWRYRGLIGNLARRELKLRHKKTTLGWLWSLINPAATLAIYTLVFGSFVRIQPPLAGNGRLRSFALFLFTGLVIWNLFVAIVNGSMRWLLETGSVLKKIAFPPITLVYAGALSSLAQSAVEMGILIVVLAVLGNASWTFLLLPAIVALLLLFAVGIGLVVSALNVYYRDLEHLTGIVTTLLFYATPIIYPLSLVPERLGRVPARRLVRLNPLTQFVESAREALYGLRSPSLVRLLALTIVSVVTFGLGRLVFFRFAADLSEEL